jgi:predicted Na+-dependent transporter
MNIDPAQLVKLAITVSVPVLVFALGLRATISDATTLFREFLRPPNRLLRAIVAMNVVVPVVAVAVAMLMNPPFPVKVAMLAMAVAPVPPVLPGKQLKFGGGADYVFGLLVAIAIVSIVLVPLGVDILGRVFGREARFGFVQVAKLVGATILLPLIAGLAVRQLAPQASASLARWASRIGTILLVAGLVPVLVKVWPAITGLVGNGSVVAIGIVVAAAIVAGHWLGGPDPDDRTTLAIASSMRHPGIALAIGSLNVPDEPRMPAAILLYVLVAAVATTIYGKVRARQQAGPA